MFLFDLLFGKNKSKEGGDGAGESKQESVAPGTGIRHDPQLVEALKEDHRALVEIFTSIDAAFKGGDLLTVQTNLERFRTALQDHLLKENVRLYVFLEHQLANDPPSHEMMHGFRREMDAIGKVVVNFLTKYKQIGIHPELAAAFGADLAMIGDALAARIKREEETLYPLYG